MYVIIMRKEIQENEFLLMGMVNLLQFYYLAFKVYKNFPPPTCFFVFFCKLFSFTILQVVLTVNHICIHLFWIGFLSCLVHFLYFLFYTSKKKKGLDSYRVMSLSNPPKAVMVNGLRTNQRFRICVAVDILTNFFFLEFVIYIADSFRK